MKYGAIIFEDLKSSKKEGWGCKEPDFVPQKINIEKIGNTIIWITNAKYEEFELYNIKNHVFLKTDRYLRISADQILKMLNAASLSHDEQSYCLANIFSNMIKYYDRFIPKKEEKGLELPLLEMRHGIRELYEMDFPVIQSTRDAIEKSALDFVMCESPVAKYNKSAIFVTAWVPKIEHGLDILREKVPKNANIISVKAKHKDTKAWIKEAMEPSCNPRLFKVSLREIQNKEIAHLFSLGNQTLRRKTVGKGRMLRSSYNDRKWITGHELVILSEFASIKIDEVLEFEESEILMARPWNISFFSKIDTPRRIGFSSGFFSELLWTGSTIALTNVSNAELKRQYINPYSPFLKSFDRMVCLKYAVDAVVNYGIDVSGYGVGKILFCLTPDKYKNFLDFCMKNSMLSTLKFENTKIEVDFSVSQDRTIGDLQNAIYYGTMKELVDLDNAMVEIDLGEQ